MASQKENIPSTSKPIKKLTNIFMHDADQELQSVEMTGVDEIFLSGALLPAEEVREHKRKRGNNYVDAIKVQEWWIGGIEEGDPNLLVKTVDATYVCLQATKVYKDYFRLMYEKAWICAEVYKMVSMNPLVSLEELSANVICSRKRRTTYFCNESFVDQFLISQGQFIYNQLNGISKEMFSNLRVLQELKEMSSRHGIFQEEEYTDRKKILQHEVGYWQRQYLRKKELREAITTLPITKTKLIERIWSGYYLNNSQENSELSNNSRHNTQVDRNPGAQGFPEESTLDESVLKIGTVVSVHIAEEESQFFLIQRLFNSSEGTKMFHGVLLQKGSLTFLGDAAAERELFLMNECRDICIKEVKDIVHVVFRRRPWGHKYKKLNAEADQKDRNRAEQRKAKGLSIEYYCKSLYSPEKGAFFNLPEFLLKNDACCHSCKVKEEQERKESSKVRLLEGKFLYKDIIYSIGDMIYVNPTYFTKRGIEAGKQKKKGKKELKAYVICQIENIKFPTKSNQPNAQSIQIEVKRFYRPEDVDIEYAYTSDIREVYYSEDTYILPVYVIQGKCEIGEIDNVLSLSSLPTFQHVFFCQKRYNPSTGKVNKLEENIRRNITKKRTNKGKCKVSDDTYDTKNDVAKTRGLNTLDIFGGCGGLAEGLHKAGASITKWAIEYDTFAAKSFKINHPRSVVFTENCNVILKAMMESNGDEDDCISNLNVSNLPKKLNKNFVSDLPLPGEVECISGGPPCQGFSTLNRFNERPWSKIQNEMVLSFLSFVEYLRPRYVLFENVRNFVIFNNGQFFRLTLASLLEMGYQVKFGILDSGAYGVSQTRKRLFIWAASPEDNLPEWPQGMHTFDSSRLEIKLSDKIKFAAVQNTKEGAPFRYTTVRDTIGDLPKVENGASEENLEYENRPVSWFQKKIRGDTRVLRSHITSKMNLLDFIRCTKIPKIPGANWHDLPNEKLVVKTGKLDGLIPKYLEKYHGQKNKFSGTYGRLDWRSTFPTVITKPCPSGKVGRCIHPEQERMLTVREFARAQGFPDDFIFVGNTKDKYRQVGNAIPPPLAYALGCKLKDVVDDKQ